MYLKFIPQINLQFFINKYMKFNSTFMKINHRTKTLRKIKWILNIHYTIYMACITIISVNILNMYRTGTSNLKFKHHRAKKTHIRFSYVSTCTSSVYFINNINITRLQNFEKFTNSANEILQNFVLSKTQICSIPLLRLLKMSQRGQF